MNIGFLSALSLLLVAGKLFGNVSYGWFMALLPFIINVVAGTLIQVIDRLRYR